MRELAVVRGTVIGEPGAPVAGWVSLGKRQPQRWVSHVVRIVTPDEREITIEGLAETTIVPVRVDDVKWRAIDSDPLAQLCSREAPAPDVEVDFTTAVLRGGDPIVAWGEATDYGYAGEAGGDAFRGTQERAITKLTPRLVAYGDDREQLLARARERWVDEARADEPVEARAPKRDPSYTNRLARNLPLACALFGLAVTAMLMVATEAHAVGLRAAAMFAFLPLALDASHLPRFRRDSLSPPDLDLPFVMFAFGALGVLLVTYGLAVGDTDPAHQHKHVVASYVAATVASLSLGWLWAATRTRRRWIAMMIAAPPHTHPVRDGVWGAIDGKFSSDVMAVGYNYETVGTGKNAGVRARSFANVTFEAPLRSADTVYPVRLAEAAILTMTQHTTHTGERRTRVADVIDASTPVRVVGRMREGAFVKGGEASLLVFAAGPDTDVARELRRLHHRHLAALVLAAAGIAALATSVAI